MQAFDELLKQTGEVGHIESILQSIVYVTGLQQGQRGIVRGIERDLIEVILLSSEGVSVGQRVARTKDSFKIQISKGLLGRIINPNNEPIDGLGPVRGDKTSCPVYNNAPPIGERVKVTQQLETGVGLIDFMVPLGKGQRELVLGDQKTGKTVFLLQTISNQAKKGTVCIYVGIGKKTSDVKNAEDYLKNEGVINNCVLVFASSSDPASLVYLAPYSGMTIAEYFRDQGNDVLIVFDDLTNHAKFYREMSLLSKRMPARESYPGDIFHIHAALLERAGRIKRGDGSVSITALPVIETIQGDLTGYLPTNAMAMTDGHIFFDESEFKKGRRPAVNVSLSVTRVGNQTQKPLEREVRRSLIEKLNLYKKAQALAHFGFDLPIKTRTDLNLGERLEAVFDQDSHTIVTKNVAILLFGLVLEEYWSSKDIEQVRVEKSKLVEAFDRGLLKRLDLGLQGVADTKSLVDFVLENQAEVDELLHSRISSSPGINKESEGVRN
jgi:F-type H+-transporting ATPase subunit alpha